MSLFKKATRHQVKLKMAVTGPSGSGKTYSALLIAKGLGAKKIAVLDTENDSVQLYAGAKGLPDFDSLTMQAPFLTDKYIQVINAAVKEGYDALIIDSISHQWSGEGGVLDRKEKEQAAKPTANSYTLWAKYTPEHERFKQAIVQAPLHLIVTMRSKQDYVLTQNEKGKQTPQKVGLAPVQREQLEYEFTTVFDLSMEHTATASKDRTGLFDGQFFTPSVETGEKLLQWLNQGSAVPTPPGISAATSEQTLEQKTNSPSPSVLPSGSADDGWRPGEGERYDVMYMLKEMSVTAAALREMLNREFKKNLLVELTRAEYQRVLQFLNDGGLK
jgi:KaiC/GvpD/RAD55 family RecA-like ATPase